MRPSYQYKKTICQKQYSYSSISHEHTCQIVVIWYSFQVLNMKLTYPAHAHWLRLTLQQKGMQHQHCSLLLQMSQSKGCPLSKHTSPSPSSQKPVPRHDRVRVENIKVRQHCACKTLPLDYCHHLYQFCFQAI